MDDSIREPLRLFNFFSIFMTVYFLPNNYSALPVPFTLCKHLLSFLHLDVRPSQHVTHISSAAQNHILFFTYIDQLFIMGKSMKEMSFNVKLELKIRDK